MPKFRLLDDHKGCLPGLAILKPYLIIIRMVPNHVLFSPVELSLRFFRILIRWVVPIHIPILPPAVGDGSGFGAHYIGVPHPRSYLSRIGTGIPFLSPAGGRRCGGFRFHWTHSRIPLPRLTKTTWWSLLKQTNQF